MNSFFQKILSPVFLIPLGIVLLIGAGIQVYGTARFSQPNLVLDDDKLGNSKVAVDEREERLSVASLIGDVPLTAEDLSHLTDEERLEIVKQPATTAAELLTQLNIQNSTAQFYRAPGKLPKLEAEKVAATLRERYPFKSLRDRLHFEVHSMEKDELDEAADVSPFDSWNLRARALEKLHSSEVEGFINRDGNGLSRRPIPSPYHLKIPAPFAKRLDSKSVGSDLLAESTLELSMVTAGEKNSKHEYLYALDAKGLPTFELATIFHQSAAMQFSNPRSNGYIKSIDEVAGFESHRVRFGEEWDGTLRHLSRPYLKEEIIKKEDRGISWKTNQLQLVSLLIHEDPVVYVSDKLPDMESLSGADAETRAMNDFERRGLEQLQGGEDVAINATLNRIEMIGAIRAREDCRSCHSTANEGDLLGAFSYEFLRKPIVSRTAELF